MTQEREPTAPRVADAFVEAMEETESGQGLEPGQTFEQPLHIRRSTYDLELGQIKNRVLTMAVRVEDQIREAVEGLTNRDAEQCLRVIQADAAVNEIQRVVSSMVGATIATQAPVAGDLRFLLTLDHVGYELERMGDHAASVAKQGRKLASEPTLPPTALLSQLGEGAAQVTSGVIRALVDVDAAQARDVAAKDDDLDALYHRIFDDVLDLMRTDPATVDRGARILFAAHALERIGDRVTNIAEDIVFLASGEVEDLNP
jgi:phosphate transport system protein